MQRDGRRSMHQAERANPLSRRDAIFQRLGRMFFRLLQAARERWRRKHLRTAALPGMATEACPFEDTQALWKELSVVAQVRREMSPGTPTRLKETESEV